MWTYSYVFLSRVRLRVALRLAPRKRSLNLTVPVNPKQNTEKKMRAPPPFITYHHHLFCQFLWHCSVGTFHQNCPHLYSACIMSQNYFRSGIGTSKMRASKFPLLENNSEQNWKQIPHLHIAKHCLHSTSIQKPQLKDKRWERKPLFTNSLNSFSLFPNLWNKGSYRKIFFAVMIVTIKRSEVDWYYDTDITLTVKSAVVLAFVRSDVVLPVLQDTQQTVVNANVLLLKRKGKKTMSLQGLEAAKAASTKCVLRKKTIVQMFCCWNYKSCIEWSFNGPLWSKVHFIVLVKVQ